MHSVSLAALDRDQIFTGRRIVQVMGVMLISACFQPAVPAMAATASIRDTTFDCLIEPSKIVRLGTSVEGILSDVMIDRGDIVKKGQVVAHMESKVEEALYALARARGADDSAVRSADAHYVFLQRKVDRLKGLVAKSIVSSAELEEAEAEKEVAHQDVNQAVSNLSIAKLDEDRAAAVLQLRTILSPVDGVVTDVLMAPGEYRNSQSQIATIAQTDQLNIEVFVSNDYFGQIRDGMTGEIVPDLPVAATYHGTVSVVDQVLDAKSGTFGVRLKLVNPEHNVPAGISCRIRFLDGESVSP